MTTIHRDLLNETRALLKAVRVIKQDLAAPGGFGVLAAIATRPGWHVKDLAAECALDPSTVSRAVAALVRDGLVARTADPDDGRACVLTATAAGRDALDDVLTSYDHRLSGALRDWTADDLQTLVTLLRRFTGDLLTDHPPVRLQEVAR